MISRRTLLAGVVSVCAVLIAFALVMALAIYRLERENADLKTKLTAAVEDVTRQLEEHRKEERDRFFQSQQTTALEAVRTRDTIKDVSKP